MDMVGIKKMKSFTLEKHRHKQAEDLSTNEPRTTSTFSLRQCRTVAEVSQLHARINLEQLDEPYTGNLLVQMYGKCRSVQDALETFSRIKHKNVYSWNLVIGACVKNGEGLLALQLLWEMECEGKDRPNQVTFLTILRACELLSSRKLAMVVSDRIRSRCSDDVPVINAMITLYAKFGRLAVSKDLFQSLGRGKDVISWTAMMTAYAQHGHPSLALELLACMDTPADRTTLLSALGACSGLGGLQGLLQGRRIHDKLLLTYAGELKSDSVLCNSLMNMFGKCGSISEAKTVFDSMNPSARTVVSWNTLILVYAQGGEPEQAMKIYRKMDVKRNEVTFVNVLPACKSLGDVKDVHLHVLESRLEGDTLVGTALVHAYDQVGALDEAGLAFRAIKRKNLVAWNALVAAVANRGVVEGVELLVREMQVEGLELNGVTLLSVLNSCSHGGWVEKSGWYVRELEVAACGEHYGCMVDILCRVGEVDKAEELIVNMPFYEDAVAWISLLCACVVQGDTGRAMVAAEHVTILEAKACAPYSLLFNSLAYQTEL